MEKGLIDDTDYESIINLLPKETPLSGAGAAAAARSRNATPVSAQYAAPPPSYNQTGPPSLPVRNQPPQPPAPVKPVVAHARALYRYSGPDARDLALERDDQIAVHEYMNSDWCMGRNLRTGREGIFPRNYVQIDEKAMHPGPPGFMAPQQHYMAPQGPAAPMQPYNSHAPPMAVAEGGGEGSSAGGSKIEEHGKNIGKK